MSGRVTWATRQDIDSLFSQNLLNSPLAVTASYTHTHTPWMDPLLLPISTTKRASLHSCKVPDQKPTLFFLDECGTSDSWHQSLRLLSCTGFHNSLCSRTLVGRWCDDSDVEAVRFCAVFGRETVSFTSSYLYKHLDQKHLKHHR